MKSDTIKCLCTKPKEKGGWGVMGEGGERMKNKNSFVLRLTLSVSRTLLRGDSSKQGREYIDVPVTIKIKINF